MTNFPDLIRSLSPAGEIRQCSIIRSALLPTSTTGKAAVKGGRRPAERTLEGCVVNDPSDKMEKAGRQAAGLHATTAPQHGWVRSL